MPGAHCSWTTIACALLIITGFFDDTKASAQAPAGMALIPGGVFSMGTAAGTASLCGAGDPTLDARPVHPVRVHAFWMDRDDVTNAQFAAFVAATHHVTAAERAPRAEDFPGVPATALVAGGLVFKPDPNAGGLNGWRAWWCYQPGADWRHPTGPGGAGRLRGRRGVRQVGGQTSAD